MVENKLNLKNVDKSGMPLNEVPLKRVATVVDLFMEITPLS